MLVSTMRIQINIDLSPEELEQASGLLQQIRDLLSVAGKSDALQVNDNSAATAKVPYANDSEKKELNGKNVESSEAKLPEIEVVTTAEKTEKTPRPAFESFAKELLGVAEGKFSPESAAKNIAGELVRAGTSEYKSKELKDCFIKYLLDREMVDERCRKGATCESIVSVLAKLPRDFNDVMKTELVSFSLKTLMVPRPADCDRLEFYGHAETVAMLVKNGLAPITAAVKVVLNLLEFPGQHCAGITLLGMTVENCPEKLATIEKETMQMLRNKVTFSIKEEELRADVDYVVEEMRW